MKNRFKYKLSAIMISAMMLASSARAESISSSIVGTGTKSLLNDVSNWIMGLSPTITIIVCIYLATRRGAADDQDAKMWEKRIKTAIFFGIFALLAGVVIKVVASYYNVTVS